MLKPLPIGINFQLKNSLTSRIGTRVSLKLSLQQLPGVGIAAAAPASRHAVHGEGLVVGPGQLQAVLPAFHGQVFRSRC